jgi:hypothetical protein
VRARAASESSRVVERRDDQQDRVGAHRARFGDLVLVDDEILAQHRQSARARAATRYSGAPWKYSRSVSTDKHAAPPARVARAIAGGSNCARRTPGWGSPS